MEGRPKKNVGFRGTINKESEDNPLININFAIESNNTEQKSKLTSPFHSGDREWKLALCRFLLLNMLIS